MSDRQSVGEKCLVTDVAHIFTEFPRDVPRGHDAYLMPAEWERVLGSVRVGPFQDFLAILKETGCRPSEAASVESQWFNRHGRCWEFPVEKSKGKLESRVVHLNKRAMEICQRVVLKFPEGPMFRTRLGTFWRRGSLNKRCRNLARKLGLRVTTYSVRHTFT